MLTSRFTSCHIIKGVCLSLAGLLGGKSSGTVRSQSVPHAPPNNAKAGTYFFRKKASPFTTVSDFASDQKRS